MDLMVKTEPEGDTPQSVTVVSNGISMDSIVKDLKSLEKHYIADRAKSQNQLIRTQTKAKMSETENVRFKKELEVMKLKMKMLDKQNSKLKSDLEASDSDKVLYYKQYQAYGREVRILKTQNDLLKVKNHQLSKSESSETTKYYGFQAILDSKITKMGIRKYLVQWSGLDENGDPWEPTWEPAKNIDDTSPAFRNFQRKTMLDSLGLVKRTSNSKLNSESCAKKRKSHEKYCSLCQNGAAVQ